MATREVYRIEIPIEAIDNYSREMDKAQKKTTKYEQAVQKSLSRIEQRRSRLLNSRWSIAINAIDKASRVISSINSFVHRVANRSYKLTIRAFDLASKTIGFIKRSIFSLPSVITIGLSIVGINKLNEATVGAAMNFEQYEVSMTHWLGGNVKQAKELITWMGKFADSTPFNSPDLFPALTTGVSVAGGNLKEAQRLLKIATDMAALTPGKTPIDAMDAIADARMGEFERMKEFGMKITKEQYKAMGGWEGFLKQASNTFLDGASKLSKTSAGIIATLKGYRGSILRSIGEGFLDPMKPRLDAINKWLENNQDTWRRWKETVRSVGEGASEWAFSKIEKGFNFIRDRYLNNDDFRNLDFKGQVSFVLSDINQWWTDKGKPAVSSWWESSGKPWAEETGLSIGKTIYDGIVLGIKEGLSGIGGLWKNAFENPSAKSIGGAATATILAGAVGSMLLSPFLRAGGGLLKGGKWVGGQVNKLGKKRVSNQPSVPKGVNPEFDSRMSRRQASKGLLGRGNKLLKRIPLLGSLLGALAIGTATKEERPGVIGGVAGGLVGAKGGALAGAAIGSAVPGVGTAIGGAAGGIIGGIGGAIGGEWVGNHWDSIKAKSGEAGDWIKDKWSGFAGWFDSTVWTPSKDLAINALNTAVGMWDYGKETLKTEWTPLSNWFQETVWSPVSTGAEVVGGWIGDKFDEGYGVVKSSWGAASEWFEENVWGPLRTGVEAVAQWFGNKLDVIKTAASGVGGIIDEKTKLIRGGVSTAIRIFKNRGSQKTGLKPIEYADGGYINRPHLGLVGEAGPEMIIPLSSGRRSRAMELYERTGRMLGVRPYANGGLVGKLVEPLVNATTYPAPIGPMPATSNTSVSFGPVSISIETGGDGEVESIVDAVIEKFGSAVIPQLREALVNRYA